MYRATTFWDPATAITQSTRSPGQRAEDAAPRAAAEKARKQREDEIEAELAVTKTLPLSIPE
jgi:hypothetical protein